MNASPLPGAPGWKPGLTVQTSTSAAIPRPRPDTPPERDSPLSAGETDLLAGLRNGAWLDQQRFPPLRYTIPGIVPEGSTLLVGPPKIGKSWFVLACGLARAQGSRALGVIPVDSSPVFYLALEDGDRRLQSRCHTLLRGAPIPPGFEYMTQIQPGRVLDTIRAWLARHTGAAPLVILDTLGKVMPPALPGESSYQRDYRIGSALKLLADTHPGASLVTNHHDRKAYSDDFVDSVSGTHGLAGAADTIVIIQRRRFAEAGLLKVTGRDIAEDEYAVRFEANSCWFLEGDTLAAASQAAAEQAITASVGDRMADVIAYVSANPAGVRPADVGKALGIDLKQAQVYLARAVDGQRLAKPKRGLYTPVGSVGSVGSPSRHPTGNQHPNTTNTTPRV